MAASFISMIRDDKYWYKKRKILGVYFTMHSLQITHTRGHRLGQLMVTLMRGEWPSDLRHQQWPWWHHPGLVRHCVICKWLTPEALPDWMCTFGWYALNYNSIIRSSPAWRIWTYIKWSKLYYSVWKCYCLWGWKTGSNTSGCHEDGDCEHWQNM